MCVGKGTLSRVFKFLMRYVNILHISNTTRPNDNMCMQINMENLLWNEPQGGQCTYNEVMVARSTLLHIRNNLGDIIVNSLI